MAHLEAPGRSRRAPAADAPVDRFVDGVETFGLAAERIVARGIGSAGGPAAGGTGGTGGNTVLSPLGIAVAFALARAGAQGETAARLSRVFGFPEGDALHEAANAVTAAVARAGSPGGPGSSGRSRVSDLSGDGDLGPEVALASSLWLQ